MTNVFRVSVIILNWNGWEDTLECLESLFRIDYPAYDVVLVDNGSTNDSVGKIRAFLERATMVVPGSLQDRPVRFTGHPRQEAEKGAAPGPDLTLIAAGENLGFTEGNNLGMRYACRVLSPDYLLLLNNDTVVDRFFLRELVRAAGSDDRIGLLGPEIRYYGKKDIIAFAGGTIDYRFGKVYADRRGEMHREPEPLVRDAGYLEGSCLLVRADVIRKTGYLDPVFFTYFEDVDWCVRAAAAGYRLVNVPAATIWHKIGASKTGSRQLYYITRNRFIFERRHARSGQFLFFLLYFFFYEFWKKTGSLLLFQRNGSGWLSFLKGVHDGLCTARAAAAHPGVLPDRR